MQPVLTAAQSAAQDRASLDDVGVLMDRAGLAVATVVAGYGIGYGDRVAVLTGPGNNGGDGYLVALYLRRRGVDVVVHPFAEPRSDGARHAAERAVANRVPVAVWDAPGRPDLIIDSVFGGGFRGELPDLDPWREPAAPVVAVDVPSGLSASTGQAESVLAPAAVTVTFQAPKVGHLLGRGPELCGEVVVADIGLPDVEPEFWLCGAEDAPRPRRPRTAHKWSAGAVLVVGGSSGLDGAATLTATSALRAGAGAVMVACPPSVEDRIRVPEIMTRAIGSGSTLGPGDVGAIAELAGRFDCVVIGPGLGTGTGGLVPGLLDALEHSLVVDADALNVLDGPDPLRSRAHPTVITPHAGEFGRLTGEQASYEAAARLGGEVLTVVLKGGPTFVMGSERWAVASGGPELATIGTGDVLAGMIGAFVAAGLPPETAARSAVFWHGVAGAELAGRRIVTADALVEQVAVTLAG